ncbi:MAG: DUF4956 domain-containing protein [Gemmatimonadetes bacterium]|nr:DUF4956 domain-containing protein [Gemmatimonadota bacterium]
MSERAGFLRSPFVRLTAYYIVLGLAAWGLAILYPPIIDSASGERLGELAQRGFGGGDPVGTSDTTMRGPVQSLLFTLFAVIGSLLLLIPVVWVYMITRQRQGYDESVVHTVVILPVAVTALVIVVQDSVALAFSLAGIVAAVRFRNTLKDTKDAVYIFVAIGTALAAGVQALGVAAVSTIVFNYLVLIMWRFRIGDIYSDQLAGRAPRMGIGDVLAGAGTPGAGVGNLTIGNPDLLAALTPDTIEEIAERRERLRRRVEDAGKGAKKFSGLLVVVTESPDTCLDLITRVVEDSAQKATLADIDRADDGTVTLEYLVGLDRDTEGTDLIATLRRMTGDCVLAAQYRNLKIEKAKDAQSTYWTLE